MCDVPLGIQNNYVLSFLNKRKIKKIPAGTQPETFQGTFSGITALDKHLIKNTRNISEFFSLILVKLHFEW